MNTNPITTPVVYVEYIGTKDRKEDNLTDSGTVWQGPGDIQPVTHQVWGKLSIHTAIWRRVEDPAIAARQALAQQAQGQQQSSGQALGSLSLGAVIGHADAAKAAGTESAKEGDKPAGDTTLTAEQVHAAKLDLPSTEVPAKQPVARKTAAKAAGTESAKEGGAQ
jgi:hypothetical protein